MISKQNLHQILNSKPAVSPSSVLASWLVCCVVLTLLCGCEPPNAKTVVKTNFLNTEIEQLHNLGWLGAKVHPLNDVVSITDPDNVDKNLTPGGMVVVELNEDSPLAEAGLKSGDLIVRIVEDWLPIKEDPTTDLIAMIETQITGNKKTIDLGYLRRGKYETTSLTIDKPSIDEGLPLATERGLMASRRGLEQLAAMQLEDGSYANDSGDSDGKIAVTAMAGLAFLSADESAAADFKSNADACLKYVADELDGERISELNPLVGAYASMFLAESDVGLMEEQWLDKIGGLSELFIASQHQTGGWNVSVDASEDGTESDNEEESISEGTGGKAEPESESLGSVEAAVEVEAAEETPTVDVFATFSTNQVLLAIGALERKGMSGENDVIEKACCYLQQQAEIRIPSSVDRRTKGALSAGTAAALVALNCERNDLALKELRGVAMERAEDMFFAPSLGLPGVFQTALSSRQMGNESWMQFHNAFKHLGIALQNPTGGFHTYPGVKREALPFEQLVAGEAWNAAHLAAILSVQSQSLKKLLAIEQPPTMVARDSLGKKSEAGSSMQAIKLNTGSADAEEIKKMIMEQLKERGMDVDESKLKFKKSAVPPDEK